MSGREMQGWVPFLEYFPTSLA